jgi:uncharacterized protein (DUF1697 family)
VADFIALFRGINVGRAKRIGMADLRRVFSDLGYTNVRTVLNSGNVLFSSSRATLKKFTREIQEAVSGSFGVSATVIVISAADLQRVVDGNPLLSRVEDPSRHLVAFAASAADFDPARRMLQQTWEPDALAVTANAAYLWCAAGVLDSKLSQAFARATRDAVTARNWTTVLKLRAATASA